MTAPKPPDNKTLVGLPNELKAILERPRTSLPPLAVKGTQEPQPAAAAQEPLQPKASMDRTLVGIPSEMQAALERALAEQAAGKARVRPRPQPAASVQVEVPPTASGPVLRVHAVRTIGVSNAPADAADAEASAAPEERSAAARGSAPARSQPSRPAPGHRPAPQQLPPRPQARAQAHERQSAPPLASTRANGPGRPSGELQSHAPSQPPGRRSASVPPLPHRQAPAQRSAASQPPTRASTSSPPVQSQAAGQQSSTRASRPSQPAPAQSGAASATLGQSQLTSQSELLAQSQITAAPFLAPNAPLNWPPAQRRSESLSASRSGTDTGAALARADASGTLLSGQPAAARSLASQPIAAEPSVIVTPDEPESQPEPVQAAQGNRPAAYNSEPREAAPKRQVFTLPPGSSNTKTSRTKAVVEAAPKRWPAIALIALAILAFGCVIVLRAPSLLPAPLAAMIAPEPKHGPGEGPSRMATAAAAAVAPVAVKTFETDTSAATSRSLAPPSPTRPPASPPLTSGVSAQLEKKAIDRLMADDYPAAKQAYERLRSAEPNRPEFGAMIEMLTRATSSACGQSGQAPCAGAAP